MEQSITEKSQDSGGGILACADVFAELCPNIAFLFDGGGRFVSCTKALLDAAGPESLDRMKGRHYREIFSDIMGGEAGAGLIEAADKAAETKKPGALSGFAAFGGGGALRYYNIELKALTGQKEGTLAVFTDVTDIMAEKKRAEASSRAKTNFLAEVTRDIRAPIDAVAEAAQCLSRTRLTAKQREYVAKLTQSSNSLASIIEDMVNFSKIEGGEAGPINNYYSPKELFENLYAMFWPLFRTKNLEFYYSVSKNMPELTYGDDKRLKQVLVNVLANGLKHTPEGHVEFYAWMSEENVLHVGIHDTGVGFRQKDIEKLYLPFEQFGPDKKDDASSAGFGLAISRKLCETMNGEFSVESTYGAGTTFSIDIPCHKEE
ncbi:MAG: HAMP domain-containing histidine kinase [Oscillospiraceae bacterium]|nr:HAMP domain-containing histidine kinase [Oscillospiraceae bacterium]